MAEETTDNTAAHYCPAEATIEIIGGKWKCQILHTLQSGTKRYGELRKKMPDVTQRVLTRKLRELEEHGVIQRKVYAEVPPKTEYSLTERGETLHTVLNELERWSRQWENALD
ncbi:helix-turn-helix domain-containing protein [Shimia sp. R9_3]|uniref:winged helix-turn-helix transcriptional regulator n=1 Tax=Shimia sp. R9_3 TaxID=2821113 RepID=UPI001ADBAF0D|nr:helix-turn-helix domain-containing protein [Shimia sp. R9_3]MBO9401156.1 helix-turn-helix transcriptional regulator [Shimia sp. R9_3]